MIWISILAHHKIFFQITDENSQETKTITMCNAFNIEPKFTASESPFSNGFCELHSTLIGNRTEKVIEDTASKLSDRNVFGFSPYQLVLWS